MTVFYPEFFRGVAPLREDIIVISKDEDEPMESLSLTSVFHLQL